MSLYAAAQGGQDKQIAGSLGVIIRARLTHQSILVISAQASESLIPLSIVTVASTAVLGGGASSLRMASNSG